MKIATDVISIPMNPCEGDSINTQKPSWEAVPKSFRSDTMYVALTSLGITTAKARMRLGEANLIVRRRLPTTKAAFERWIFVDDQNGLLL